MINASLTNITEKFSYIKIKRDGKYSSFGLLESKTIPNVFVYLISEKYIPSLNKNKNISAVLTTDKIAEKLLATTTLGIAVSDNPAKDFYNIHNDFAKRRAGVYQREFRSTVGKRCTISTEAYISQTNVKIGDDVVIEPGAVIMDNVEIGNNCVIGANTVIGTRGFQFFRGEDKSIYVEHVGGVRIGNNVEIFSNSTIATGLFEPTQIGDNVKIDNHVQISHSAVIGRNTMIPAGAIIAGSAHIGEHVWLGVNSTIAQLVHIGDNAYVCMGSVVAQDVEHDMKVSGNFAEEHISRLIRQKRLERLAKR